MPNDEDTVEEGYDPRTDPDSAHYDPDYDPDSDPWNDPNYDPFEDDFDPETGERNDEEPEPDYEIVCEAVYCETVEVERGRCMDVCRVECNNGVVITTFEPTECPWGSE